MYLIPLHMFQQKSCQLHGGFSGELQELFTSKYIPFLNSPSQLFQLFHLFKGYYLSYVFTSSCILISTQVHRCAGISCILSHPLPFKKHVRLAHGRYSHVIVSSFLSTNMSASITTWPLRPLSAWPTAATATEPLCSFQHRQANCTADVHERYRNTPKLHSCCPRAVSQHT
jgi:hypothetical protein